LFAWQLQFGPKPFFGAAAFTGPYAVLHSWANTLSRAGLSVIGALISVKIVAKYDLSRGVGKL
jgi:hypothetical protein